jgi:VWFA-related protein
MAIGVLTVLLAAAVQASPSPSPSPQKPAPPIPGLGVTTEILELDVVVTGKDGKPLRDLNAEDFEVVEDGQVQPITHFARGFGPVVKSAARPPSGPAPFPDEATPRGRYLVLAVDDYHIQPSELSTVRASLNKFVDSQLAPDDQVAVVATSGSLGALQQFTTERAVLRRAIDQLRAHDRSFRPPLDVPRLTDYQAQLIEQGDAEALDLAVQEILATEPRVRQTINNQTRLEQQVRTMARQIVLSTAHVTTLTLQSLERVVRTMLPLRGRKVVAFFSGGFFLGTTRESTRRDLQVIADAAMRSGVVVYTLDARGLVAVSAIGDASVGGGYNITTNPGARERMELRAVDAARDGLNALAEDTGGLALFNRNDLGVALESVLEDSATYYRLGYEPVKSPREGEFRKIEVRVPSRSGLKVRTATGYFGQAAASAAAVAAASLQTPSAQEENATTLLRTALDSSVPLRGLPLELSADFLGTSTGDVVVATIAVDASRLLFRPTSDGREAAAFDLVGVVVDDKSVSVGQFSDRVELSLAPEAKEKAVRNGITYRKSIGVRPGFLQARVAARDDGNGLLGSASQWVEVPDRAKKRLALSSIVVLTDGEEVGSVPAADARGTVSFEKSTRADVARSFPRTAHLDYALLAYDRPKAGAAPPPNLTVERELLSGTTSLVRSPPAPVGAADSPAGGVQAITGRLRLDAFKPGEYELKLVVTDSQAKATETRSLKFRVE